MSPCGRNYRPKPKGNPMGYHRFTEITEAMRMFTYMVGISHPCDHTDPREDVTEPGSDTLEGSRVLAHYVTPITTTPEGIAWEGVIVFSDRYATGYGAREVAAHIARNLSRGYVCGEFGTGEITETPYGPEETVAAYVTPEMISVTAEDAGQAYIDSLGLLRVKVES